MPQPVLAPFEQGLIEVTNPIITLAWGPKHHAKHMLDLASSSLDQITPSFYEAGVMQLELSDCIGHLVYIYQHDVHNGVQSHQTTIAFGEACAYT